MQNSFCQNIDRRNFLKRASVLAVALPVVEFSTLGLLGCTRQAQSHASPASQTPEQLSWKTTIIPEGEVGQPLIISGTIYATDGRTPMEGANLFVYQTDATGVYTTRGGDNRNTRIHGQMRTNTDGRYEFRTIKPGSYPASRIPAHIHAYVSAPSYPEYWIDEYHFADDPFVTDDLRRKAGNGSFSSILTLTRGSDGVLRGVRDIKIERCTNNCTGR